MDLTLTWQLLLLLFFVAMAAAFVDTIAGGGGLIVLPVLLLCGVPPINAIGTNKVQSVFGTLSASAAMIRRGLVDLRQAWRPFCMALLGSAIGTVLMQFVSPHILDFIIPAALIGIGFYFLLMPSAGQVERKPRLSENTYNASVVPAIGFYDGFFGPGAGSMYALSRIALRGKQIIPATAYAKVMNFASNLASVILYVLGGKVIWTIGLCMMAGSFLGANLGAQVVVSHGVRIIRPLMVIMCFGMVGRYFYQLYF